MKYLSLVILAVIAAGVQAITFSTLATVSLTLITMNKPVNGFFGFFRRRSPKPASVIEELSPQGPVEFPPSELPGGGFFSPFAGPDRGGFFPGFGNMQGFPGGLFQNQFMPQMGQSPWSQPPKRPAFQQPGKFPSSQMSFQQQSGNFPQQNVFQQQQGQFPPQNVPFPPQQMPQFEQDFNQEFDSQSDSDRDSLGDEPQINTEEAESFFTLLAETDENKCISRLVCEMGADPQTAGALGTTISDIIGSLSDFPEGSKVLEYNQILQNGRTDGLSSCQSKFSSCDEESYELMKNSQDEPSNE